MIDISQWRASIGLWACCQTSYTTHSKDAPNTERISRIDGVTIIRKIKDLTFALGVFLSLLLILSGDVELNPGPETGKSTITINIYSRIKILCHNNLILLWSIINDYYINNNNSPNYDELN